MAALTADRVHLTHPEARRLVPSATVVGVVEEGDHRGRELGWPTANLPVVEGAPLVDGVYAGWFLRSDGSSWPTAVSVGRRLTFYGTAGSRLAEAHLIGFDGHLVGERARLVLVWYLRSQRRFASTDDLAKQIELDVRAAGSAAGRWRQAYPPSGAVDEVRVP